MGSEGGTADVAWQHGHCIRASTCAAAAVVLLVVVAVARAGDIGSVSESSSSRRRCFGLETAERRHGIIGDVGRGDGEGVSSSDRG